MKRTQQTDRDCLTDAELDAVQGGGAFMRGTTADRRRGLIGLEQEGLTNFGGHRLVDHEEEID